MLLQQYIGDSSKAKPSLAELNAKLAHHKSGEAEVEENPPYCALIEAVKAVKELPTAPDQAMPAGSVFLARGGLLLDEARKLKANSEVDDGEVVDLTAYPVLLPILSAFSSPKAVTVAVTHEDAAALSASGDHTSTDSIASIVHPKELASVTTPSTDDSPHSEMGYEDSPQVTPVSRVTSMSWSSKSKLNWSEFSSTLMPTMPAEALASPGRVVKLASSLPPSHVVVLQHGFLGQSYDMQLIENAIRLEFPGRVEVNFLMFFSHFQSSRA